MNRETQLRNQIFKAKQAYYYGGEPIITDQEYDALEDELRLINPDDPILHIVGAPVPPDAMLTKAQHRIAMGSQSKVNSAQEFRTWYEKSCADGAVHVSLKGDGASAAAYYEDGELKQVISRGDGLVGEDITANATKFKGLPVYLPGFSGAIRCEVILTVEDWGIVDPTRAKNPRNAGTGIMGRKNGKQAELLTCFAFDIEESREGVSVQFSTELEKIRRLEVLGVKTIAYKICNNAQDVCDYFEEIATSRATLPIWIDGVVIKVNDLAVQAQLGETGGRPKGQIAWKFDSDGAASELLSVTVSGGHTGALIPNAQFSPVQIGGTTVANASLANWAEVERLGLAIGDKIWVIKANDIIPKVVHVIEQGQSRQPIEAPVVCPFCAGEVGKRVNTGGEEGVILECKNEECPKKSLGKIKRWIDSVDLQGIGDSVRHALVEQFDLENAAGLYRLHEVPERLANLIINTEKDLKLGEKRAASILEGIEARRQLTLVEFLGSLGIDRLGKRRVELMASSVAGELSELQQWRSGKLRDVAFAERAGVPTTGAAIQDGIDAMSDLIDDLLKSGVQVSSLVIEDKPEITGERKRVCISGKLPSGKKKADYKAALEEAGYELVDAVNAETSYLVLAEPDSTSSKAKKARQLNISILSEDQLEQLIAGQLPS